MVAELPPSSRRAPPSALPAVGFGERASPVLCWRRRWRRSQTTLRPAAPRPSEEQTSAKTLEDPPLFAPSFAISRRLLPGRRRIAGPRPPNVVHVVVRPASGHGHRPSPANSVLLLPAFDLTGFSSSAVLGRSWPSTPRPWVPALPRSPRVRVLGSDEPFKWQWSRPFPRRPAPEPTATTITAGFRVHGFRLLVSCVIVCCWA